ncbi:Arc family DNA-binding protein [Morganella morganii]|uniref:Arc family DNA-binding protein n=1 Tax=Morganella morganii TaxID=582 RepID=UPI000E650718|nr:Arc family DNA-binding protein [Morganella morganii]
MAKKDVQLNIRMTQELKDRIEKSAKINNRTINAEAITLIEIALSGVAIPQNLVPDDLITQGIIDEEDRETLNNMLSELIQDQVSKFTEKAVDSLHKSIKTLSDNKTKL